MTTPLLAIIKKNKHGINYEKETGRDVTKQKDKTLRGQSLFLLSHKH
jgi:hypothetical protein